MVWKCPKEVVDCYRQSLTCLFGVKVEHQSVERNADSAGLAWLLRFRGKKDFPGNWATGHQCCVLTKNLAAFCPHPEYMNEAELKSNRLSCLVERIS